MTHRHRELIWAVSGVPLAMLTGVSSWVAYSESIPALAIVGALGTLVLLWRWQEATVYLWTVLGAPPEPMVSPFALRRHTDRLADLARALRESRAHGAAEVQSLAHDALNLERQSRGLPPMAPYKDVSREKPFPRAAVFLATEQAASTAPEIVTNLTTFHVKHDP